MSAHTSGGGGRPVQLARVGLCVCFCACAYRRITREGRGDSTTGTKCRYFAIRRDFEQLKQTLQAQQHEHARIVRRCGCACACACAHVWTCVHGCALCDASVSVFGMPRGAACALNAPPISVLGGMIGGGPKRDARGRAERAALTDPSSASQRRAALSPGQPRLSLPWPSQMCASPGADVDRECRLQRLCATGRSCVHVRSSLVRLWPTHACTASRRDVPDQRVPHARVCASLRRQRCAAPRARSSRCARKTLG